MDMAQPDARLGAAIARLRRIVREERIARGEDPDRDPTAANIEYNSSETGRRAAVLLAYLERAYGFSAKGKAVADFGCGYGGVALHCALEHDAGSVVAVDKDPFHIKVLEDVVAEFAVARLRPVAADLQAISGIEESLDLILLNDVLYRADLSPARVAASCAQALRPGGIVLFRNVNRACGREAVTHREGTQFLDPDSADRAARFLSGNRVSTLDHRPLSPWGLAAFLRQAGFDALRFYGDTEGRYDRPQGTQGLSPWYLLSARKGNSGPRPFHRVPPPSEGLVDLAPYRDAVDRNERALREAAARLGAIFGAGLSPELARSELRRYLVGRLLMDGLQSFRLDESDLLARDFAKAVVSARDHALVAALTRGAHWRAAEFAAAEPAALSATLGASIAAIRAGFKQPSDGSWAGLVDWNEMGSRAAEIVLSRRQPLGGAIAARLLRQLVADRFRLHAVGVFEPMGDPLTGSLEEEYTEAALDRIEGEIRDAADPAQNGPRPVCREESKALLEEIERALASRASSGVEGTR